MCLGGKVIFNDMLHFDLCRQLDKTILLNRPNYGRSTHKTADVSCRYILTVFALSFVVLGWLGHLFFLNFFKMGQLKPVRISHSHSNITQYACVLLQLFIVCLSFIASMRYRYREGVLLIPSYHDVIPPYYKISKYYCTCTSYTPQSVKYF